MNYIRMRELDFQILKQRRERLKKELEEIEEEIMEEKLKRAVLESSENIKKRKNFGDYLSNIKEDEEQRKAHLFKEILKNFSK